MSNHTRVSQGVIQQWYFLISVGLGLATLVFLCHRSEALSKYDRENWVNPDDMLHYDRSTKTMKTKKPQEGPEIDNREHQTTNDNLDSWSCEKNTELENELREQLVSCENHIKNLKQRELNLSSEPEPVPEEISDKNKCKNANMKVEFQYMRRFINMFLRASKLLNINLEKGETKQSVISVDVSSEHLKKLNHFVASDLEISLSEVDDIVSHMLHSSSHAFPPSGWLEHMSILFAANDWVLARLVPYMLTLVVLTMLKLRRSGFEIFVTVMVLVLMLSYNYTHDYLVQKAEIDHYTTLKKYDDVPSYCRPPETYWQHAQHTFRYYFTYGMDECNKIHEALLMEPARQVPATIILVTMLSDMLLQPAGKFGESVAKFSSKILGGLPLFVNWLVLVIVFILIALFMLLVVIMLLGRGLRFSSIFGRVELTEQPRVRVPEREAVQEIQNQQLSTIGTTALTNPDATSAVTPAPTNPLVSALSCSEGLVLMNMPGLERLISSRDERTPGRNYVEHLAPAETLSATSKSSVTGSTAEPTSVGLQRDGSGGEDLEGKTIGGGSKRLHCSDPLAGGDTRVHGRVVNESTAVASQDSSCIGGAPGDENESVLDSTAHNSSFEMSTHLETSEFIEEVRKILEEDLSTGEDLEQGFSGKAVEGKCIDFGGGDRSRVQTSTETEGGEDGSSALSEVLYASGDKVIKRGSSNSSDASEEFVKL